MDLKDKEKTTLSYWSAQDTNNKVRAARLQGKKFYFLDGPPYVTGELGSHHIWVETIKDIVVRYKRYRGFHVHDRAGFDVHGLPIENKVEKKLGLTSKLDIEQRIGIDNFVMQCRDYAKEQAASAIATFERFGSSLDFEHVYLPYTTDYISKGWKIFKGMYEKGLLYRELQPLAYCPHCETVLSAQGPEIEYEDESDPSIFVRFKVDPKRSAKSKVKLGPDTYLVVWTTTPWTLPANIAIAANPKEVYVTVASEGLNYIVAKSRLDSFTEQTGISNVITSEFYGSDLEGVYYRSPLEEQVPEQAKLAKYHKVILSDSFVSVSEGTGLLHVAPGHGLEDYRLGKKNKLPIFSPVDSHAQFTQQAGTFAGLKVPIEANSAVLDKIKENGSLLFKGTVRHSYPHCWRCNSKLITRSTEQWFINVEKIKKKMLRENKKIIWHPTDASEWFADAVQSSPDWCMSRQRYWGAPIPIWICDKCGKMEVIGSVGELTQRASLKEEPSDLHRPYVDRITFKCASCDGTMTRVTDVFDVWYDSGIAHTASLSEEEFKRLFPADWITESRDQIRGWFTVLLRTSVAVYGKKSFNRVNIGGMIKDELGREMHRHLGNAVNANGLLEIVSADGFRLWNSSHPRWLELKLKKDELVEADSNIMTLYNISQLVKEFGMLSGVDLRTVTKPPSASSLEPEERWILSRLNTLIGDVTEKMDEYYIDEAVEEIKEFILEDFSKFYLKFAKQRAELADKKTITRIAKLTAYVLRQTAIVASMIIPFTCESIYQEIFSQDGRSIFLENWPKAQKRLTQAQAEGDFELLKSISKSVLYLREVKGAKLRWPIQEARIETTNQEVMAAVARISQLLEMYTNSRSIKVIERERLKKEIKPVFGKLGPSFKAQAQMIGNELAKANAEDVEKEISKVGRYILHTPQGVFDILPEHFVMIERSEAESGTSFRYSNSEVYVEINSEITEEMKRDITTREVIRRIQIMRKERSLTRMDRIVVFLSAEPSILSVLKDSSDEIKGVVKASKIEFGKSTPHHSKNWEILGADVTIGIEKI